MPTRDPLSTYELDYASRTCNLKMHMESHENVCSHGFQRYPEVLKMHFQHSLECYSILSLTEIIAKTEVSSHVHPSRGPNPKSIPRLSGRTLNAALTAYVKNMMSLFGFGSLRESQKASKCCYGSQPKQVNAKRHLPLMKMLEQTKMKAWKVKHFEF